MRKFGKFLGRLLLILIVLGVVVYVWKSEQITRLMAVNSLFTEEKIVSNFSNMDTMFLTLPMSKGPGPVSPLPKGGAMEMPEGYETWLKDRAVTALIVMTDGEVLHESYHMGTQPEDRRISWSVAKSFLSALFGIILEEGAIASIDDPVVKYAPSLKGTAYDKATIRNVLQMSSGIVFDEDYLDFWSDINKMGRVIALGTSMDGFTEALSETHSEPGAQWQYVSIDTHVLGMVIRGATGRSIADLMQEKIFDHMGVRRRPLLHFGWL